MPDMPIIDGHHHIWRQADLPWLMGPEQPRIFGPYEAIRRDYDIDEFKRNAAELGIVKSVYVQTNWKVEDAVEEVEEVVDAAKALSAFKVAYVVSAEQHPDADRLRVCNVLTDEGEKQIVCGAPNAREEIGRASCRERV